MINGVSRKFIQIWAAPLLTIGALLVPLFLLIPYAASYGSFKRSLGMLIYSLCNFGGNKGEGRALDYSYCLLVPPIVLYLIYLKKDEIVRLPLEGSRWGLLVLLIGFFVYWFGIRAEMQYFGYASIQILLAGVVLWFWGVPLFRKLLFPWGFCLFAWPMPFLDPIIALRMRVIMNELAHHLLSIVGIPNVQSGTALYSAPDPIAGLAMGARFQIDIADPCSGIRSLFALLMFSALFAYLFVPRLWQQWTLFLAAFPLAIVGNVCRVVLLVFGCLLFGAPFAIGTDDAPSNYHEGCGFAIYAVALGLEFLLAEIMMRIWGRTKAPEKMSAPA